MGEWKMMCRRKEVEEEEDDDDETYSLNDECVCVCAWLQLVEFVNYHFPFPIERKLQEDERTFSAAAFFIASTSLFHRIVFYFIFCFFFSLLRISTTTKRKYINALNNFQRKWQKKKKKLLDDEDDDDAIAHSSTYLHIQHCYICICIYVPSLNCLRWSICTSTWVLIRFCLLLDRLMFPHILYDHTSYCYLTTHSIAIYINQFPIEIFNLKRFHIPFLFFFFFRSIKCLWCLDELCIDRIHLIQTVTNHILPSKRSEAKKKKVVKNEFEWLRSNSLMLEYFGIL